MRRVARAAASRAVRWVRHQQAATWVEWAGLVCRGLRCTEQRTTNDCLRHLVRALIRRDIVADLCVYVCVRSNNVERRAIKQQCRKKKTRKIIPFSPPANKLNSCARSQTSFSSSFDQLSLSLENSK